MSRRQAATSLAAGLALIVAAPLVWWVAQPDPAGQTISSVNATLAQELTSSAVTSGESRGSVAGPVTGNSLGAAAGGTAAPLVTTGSAADHPVPTPSETVRSAALPDEAVPDEAVPDQAGPDQAVPDQAVATTPQRIEIPALGVDTTVVPVGVDDQGLMEIPQDVGTVGWYRFGPAPGAAAGSAVLSGHVDDYRQGVGVFGRIGDLGPGEVIRVSDETGTTREFSVISREEWSKGAVPLDRLFDRGGSSRLVLITCGGSFNSDTLGYDDNIAITAVPAGT